VNASCLIHVTFLPSSFIEAGATLIITDDAPDSPQSVALKGIGATYLLHLAAGAPNTAQVTAGVTASYTLTLESSSQRDTITLSCAAVIPQGACSISPTQVQLPVTGPTTLMVTANTTANASAFGAQRPRHFGPLNILGFCVLSIALLAMLRRSVSRGIPLAPVHVVFALILLPMLMLILSCGGGSGPTPAPPPPVAGTPRGTYNLMVNAASSANSPSQSVPLTLQVK
jgi:hypothetical protein